MPAIGIAGSWREGYALDLHTISSKRVADDEFGHPRFETTYTHLGGLLYRLKYKGDDSAAGDLADAAAAFVRSWNPDVELIIPVPPSKSGRPRQPVFLLAQALGKRLDLPVALDAVVKSQETSELKNVDDYATRIKLLQGAHTVKQAVVEKKKVLLLDDLYRSGATMNAVAGALYSQGHASAVYALAITKTRSKT